MRFPSSPSSSSGSTPNSPSNSPTKKKPRLSIDNILIKMPNSISTNNVQLTSGDPMTHPNVAEGAQDEDKIPVEHTDRFVCAGGVNVTTLLRITRIALMDHAERRLGANSVVNEQWECIISGPKPVHSRTYKVQIRYTASATLSSVPDCRRPVALDQAKSHGIPGLMSILKRND